MNPLESLSRDHVHISLALDAIEAAIAQARQDRFNLATFEQIVDFLEIWADGMHYDKEEHLFVELEGRGLPRAAGPTSFLEMEHDVTRDYTRRMRRALEAMHAGQPQQHLALIDALSQHGAILRVHMPKEDLGYFRMAAAMLDQAGLARLESQFAQIEARMPASMADAVASLQHQIHQTQRFVEPQPPPVAPAPPSLHEAQDRQAQEILHSLKLGAEGTSSLIHVTRRRRPG